jgi:hypothetical protein
VNAQDCDLYVLDSCAAVTVDDSKNCRIFIGPTDGRCVWHCITEMRVCEVCVCVCECLMCVCMQMCVRASVGMHAHVCVCVCVHARVCFCERVKEG